MKARRELHCFLLVWMACAFMTPSHVKAQGTADPAREPQVEPQPTLRPPARRLAVRPRPLQVQPQTSLEVQLFSKEFEEWSNSVTLNSSETRVFRWSTTANGVTGAVWAVTGTGACPPAETAPTKAHVVHPLAQGELTGAPGSSPQNFEIDFSSVLPRWPPARPGVYTYYVHLATLNAQRQPVGTEAQPVRIFYRAAPSGLTFSNSCASHSDCPGAQVCNPENQECADLVYRCEDDHLIVGTDGTSSNCSPYRCVGDTCRTSCASVDDCWNISATGWPENVCDPGGHCVAAPSQ